MPLMWEGCSKTYSESEGPAVARSGRPAVANRNRRHAAASQRHRSSNLAAAHGAKSQRTIRQPSLIRAMCNAAKVDGDIDRTEQDAILGRLGDVSRDEIDFVRRELGSPLDIDGFCDSVPDELAQHAYAFSVMAIKIDTISEAAYLGRLGAGLELDTGVCNDIHEQVGAPCIYAE